MYFNPKHPPAHAVRLQDSLHMLICDELKPLLQVCRIFGLVPFSLKTYQSTTRHYVTLAAKGAIIVCSILGAIFYGSLRYMRKPMESLLFTIVQYLIMSIQLICVGNVYIRCLTQRSSLISILQRLQTVTFHLKTLLILQARDSHHVRTQVFTYTIMFYVNIIITYANMPSLFKDMWSSILFSSAHALSSLIVFFVELQYIILFYVLYRKFFLINHHLSEQASVSEGKPFSQPPQHHFKQMVIIHNKLCDLCYDVNSVFNQQILIVITSHFTYIICNIYYVVVIFMEAMHGRVAVSKHVIFISLIMYWCLYKSVHLVWIVYYATKTQNEGNKTYTHFQEKHSQYFGQLLARQNINLTVCGLFPLDFTLLYTIVGTATTYWIILIQLQFLIPQQIPAEDNLGNNVTTS